MNEQRFNFDLVFKAVIITGLSLSLSTPAIAGLGYSGPGFWIRLSVTLAAIGFYLLLRYYPLTAVVFPLALVVIFRFYYLNPRLFLETVKTLFSFKQPADSLFWPSVSVILITLVIYLIVFQARRPLQLLFAAGFSTTALLWYRYIDAAYPAVITYSIFWLILLSYNRGLPIWTTASSDVDSSRESCSLSALRKTWFVYTFSILVLVLVLTLILPKNISPAPWPGLHGWAAEHLTFLHNLRPPEDERIRGDGTEFSLLEFGWQEEQELGGPLYLDHTVFLVVKGASGTYLKGSVLDYYNSHSWANSAEYRELDNLPQPPDMLLPELEEGELTIRHLRLRTSTLFTGLYPQVVTVPPGTVMVSDNDYLVLEKSVPLYYEYRIKSYRLLYRPQVKKNLETEDLLIPDRFLQLPKTLPSRVISLAKELTADLEDNYHKLRALETYLRRHYRYTTTVPDKPVDQDFVDWFLFDLEEGYCSFFATALAVMGRTVGIPTRYVSGFIIPAVPAANGFYYLAGTDAHAWVEAYVPGLGWLPFEATPGYASTSSLPLHTRDQYQDYFSAISSFNQPESQERLPRDFEPNNDWQIVAPLDSLDPVQIINRLVLGFALLILFLLAGFIVLLFFRLRQVRKHFEKLEALSSRGQAVGYYNLTLDFLKQIALGKYPGETPREHSLRIAREVHLWDLSFQDITAGISLALYSRQPVPVDLADQTRQFYHVIFDRYLATAGRLTAFVEILIKGCYFHAKQPRADFPGKGGSINSLD